MRAPEVFFNEWFVGWGPEDHELAHRLCVRQGYTPVYHASILAYHLETVKSKPFATGRHEDIVNYLRNTFYFYDTCLGLPLDEVFDWLPRLVLNPATNTWAVRSRPPEDSYNLEEIVQVARTWLAKNYVYPS